MIIRKSTPFAPPLWEVVRQVHVLISLDNRDDYEEGYVGGDCSWSNDWNTVYVTVTNFDDYGTDEGWCDSGGLLIKASKDGGNNSSERYEE